MTEIFSFSQNQWNGGWKSEQQDQALDLLENGCLLYFPELSFSIAESEKKFLCPEVISSKVKNISFNIHSNSIRGVRGNANDIQRVKFLLSRYSQYALNLVHQLFPHYQSTLQIGRTSYRPIEIVGRKTSYRKDDKRLHVDAFPATPNQGKRLLRVFCNINPDGEDRVWRVGESFEMVANRFLPQVPKQILGSARFLKLLRFTKSYRTQYDHIMLQIHNRMKADETYQNNAQQKEIRFPPGSAWIVQTDQISHAAMSGQYLLEQTFYLPVEGMRYPERSPLKVLERLMGRSLV